MKNVLHVKWHNFWTMQYFQDIMANGYKIMLTQFHENRWELTK